MKHLIVVLLIFSCHSALYALPFQDPLEEELRRVAQLEKELQPLAEPILIRDVSIRAFTNGRAIPFIVDTFMAQPPAHRILRFDMVGQKKPLLNSNGGALGCGWFVELNGHFWVTAFADSLDTRWAGHGKVITDPVIDVATSIQPRGYVKPPPCPVYINCRWVQKCRWGICVPWYECSGRILDCSKCSIGGGFEVLPPRLELQATIPYKGVEITARPLNQLEAVVVSALGETPGLSTSELAVKIMRPASEVEDAAQLLGKASLIKDSSGWRLADTVKEARFRTGGIILIDVVQPNVYYIINFRKCLDLPFIPSEKDPCLEIKEEFPSGRLATASLILRHETELPIAMEDTQDLVFDGPWKGRKVKTNALAIRFLPTSDGVGLDGLVRSRWSDVAETEKYLKVHLTDTGNGEAILIETPSLDPVTEGKRLLIGAGSIGGRGRFPRYLERTAGLAPNSRIDYFIVPNPGSDVTASAIDILDNYAVRTLVHPGAPGGLQFRRLLRKAHKKGVQVVNLLQEDIRFDLGGKVTADVLHSYDPALPVGWWQRTRNASIVLKLKHDKRTFLFTGAIGDPVEKALLGASADLRSDVLKVSDSGSASASSTDFLTAVAPRIAVISALGSRWQGSRPAPATVVRLRDAGALVISTSQGDEEDSIRSRDHTVIFSDGEALSIVQFDPALNQWRPVTIQ
jgi:competence protein ComEC